MTTTTTPRTTPTTDPAARSRTALRLDHTRELLTLLPHQLGFHPQDSVVLVALRPPGRGVGLMARLDLPDVLAPDGPGLVAGAVGHLEADGAREVVVVVYADGGDPRDPARGLRARSGSGAVRAAEVARGAAAALGPVTVWCVVGNRYLGLDCRDRGCCPPGGRPLTDLSGGELAGVLVARGEVAPSRAEVAVIRPAPPGPRRAAAGARSRWLDARLRVEDPAAALRWRQRSLDGWRGALAVLAAEPGAAVSAATLGRVEAGLLDPVVRDAVVLTLVGGDAGLPDALLRAAPGAVCGYRTTAGDPDDPDDPDDVAHVADGAEVVGSGESAVERAGEALAREPGAAGDADAGGPGATDLDAPDPDADGGHPGDGADESRGVSGRVRDALDVLVDPSRGREPDDVLAGAARTLLERVVAHGRRDRQAPALTVLALLAWWGGDAVRASVLVDRALDQDPGHRLAALVDRALGYGLPPGWLRRRC